MEHSHVKNLINLGYLVDESIKELIEGLNENQFYTLVEDAKRENPFMINRDIVLKAKSSGVKVLKTFSPLEKFTVQEMVRSLNDRYSVLQNILLRRVEFSDLVSINKISAGSVSVIGLVKDKIEKENNLLVALEDSTGDVQVTIPKALGERLCLDDVVAVSGNMSGKMMIADKLVYPDVPIRPVKYSPESIRIAFLSDDKDCSADYVVLRNKIIDKIKNRSHQMSNPCMYEVEGVSILTLLDFNPLDVIRKRYVSKDNTDFIIDPVPDIIFTDKDVNSNYKGITIVSFNKAVDLKSREVSNI
jgi:DNA polymerase II small subunit/DNA polymerase delta subunit B